MNPADAQPAAPEIPEEVQAAMRSRHIPAPVNTEKRPPAMRPGALDFLLIPTRGIEAAGAKK